MGHIVPYGSLPSLLDLTLLGFLIHRHVHKVKVERAGKDESFCAMEGFYQFEQKDVTLIAVTELPPPPSRSRSSPNQPGPSGYRSVTTAPATSSPTAAKALEDKKEPPSLDPPSK